MTFKNGLYNVSQALLGARVPLTSPQFYGFSDMDDFRQAMPYIAQFYPHAPLLGLGFSLGANILTRHVAEEGESCRLVSACALPSVRILSPFTFFVTDSRVSALEYTIYSGQVTRMSSRHSPLRNLLTRVVRSSVVWRSTPRVI